MILKKRKFVISLSQFSATEKNQMYIPYFFTLFLSITYTPSPVWKSNKSLTLFSSSSINKTITSSSHSKTNNFKKQKSSYWKQHAYTVHLHLKNARRAKSWKVHFLVNILPTKIHHRYRNRKTNKPNEYANATQEINNNYISITTGKKTNTKSLLLRNRLAAS